MQYKVLCAGGGQGSAFGRPPSEWQFVLESGCLCLEGSVAATEPSAVTHLASRAPDTTELLRLTRSTTDGGHGEN